MHSVLDKTYTHFQYSILHYTFVSKNVHSQCIDIFGNFIFNRISIRITNAFSDEVFYQMSAPQNNELNGRVKLFTAAENKKEIIPIYYFLGLQYVKISTWSKGSKYTAVDTILPYR